MKACQSRFDREGHAAVKDLLCLGRQTGSVAKAVDFQNYEGLLRPEDVRKDYRPELTQVRPARFKGGFLLPREIREAEVIMDNGASKPNAYASLPFPPKQSAESTATGP